MNVLKKISLFIFLTIIFLANLVLPVQAAETDPVQFNPQVGIPGSEFETGVKSDAGSVVTTATSTILKSDLIGRYIFAVYNWMLGIVGVVALLTIMAAGILWLTSGGDSSKITKAKELIVGSISGIALTVGAWFLLNTINPNLTKMFSIDFEVQGGEINTCRDVSTFSACTRIDFCYWIDNKCITKSDSIKITGGALCSLKKTDIKEKFPICCCKQITTTKAYDNCSWSVKGDCRKSCGDGFSSVNDAYCSE